MGVTSRLSGRNPAAAKRLVLQDNRDFSRGCSMHLPFDFDRLSTLVVGYGLNVLGAIAIAVAGWWVAGGAERLPKRALMASPHMDITVAGFLASLVRYALLAVTLVLMMQVVGIQA